MKIINQTIEVGGQNWKIREAVSLKAAEDAIAMCRCTGSVGTKTSENETVMADVVRLNEDGSERQPYGATPPAMHFSFTDKDGKPLNPQGWRASYDKSVDTAYAPIHVNGETVALIVTTGSIGSLIGLGQFVTKACNEHAALLEYFKAATGYNNTVGHEDATVEDERKAEARFDAATQAAHKVING